MKILIVDDHPMTAEGYRNAISSSIDSCDFIIAENCKNAFFEISKTRNELHFDIALIDKGLPEYPEEKLFSGVDVALLLRKVNPGCKVIMISAHTEYLVVYDIFKKVKPEGMISKGELTPQNLTVLIEEVLNEENYLSPFVKECINEIWKKDLMVDDFNRQILFYMSKGYKLKELEGVIFLATSTIQRRVINMKKVFDVSDDSSLIKIAIQQGFI